MASSSDAGGLRNDVLKFASELGLAAGGSVGANSNGGFDDRDFRKPAGKSNKKKERKENKAKENGKKREKTKREKKTAGGGDAEKSPGGKNKPTKQHTRFGGDQQPTKQQGEQGAAKSIETIVQERQWNEGAGPIPDSLLGDSAALSDLDEILSGNWFDIYEKLQQRQKRKSNKSSKAAGANANDNSFRLNERQVDELRERAEKFAGDFAQRAEIHMKKYGGQDAQWLMTARSKGTVRDKIAAASLLVQQNVISNVDSLEMLVSWVVRNKGSRDGIGHAVDALCELFSTTLLPDRKLKYFSDQRFPSQRGQPVDDKLLIVYYIEDRMKSLYHEFVDGLEVLTKENLEFLKQRAMKSVFTLLKTKPELEARLLSILINKLGDPSRKIASNAVYFMHCLLEEHPGMKSIVVQDVENFLFRPGLSQRAQYTSVIFLNQIILSKNEFEGGSKLAEKLINVYFGFFQILVSQNNSNSNSKNNKNKSQQQGGSTKTAAEIDSKILGALLTGANRAFPFVSDNEIDKLIENHSPKLFQLVHGTNFGTCVQALILLYQLYSTRMSLSDRYYRALYNALLKPEILTSNKAPLFLSVLFKSLKADINKIRVATFLNRLVQISAEAKSNFTCGALLLVSETMKHFPTLWAYVNESAASSTERFQDEDESGSEDNDNGKKEEEEGDKSEEEGEEGEEEEKENEKSSKDATQGKQYDMLKRDPQHSGMEESCFWELSLLSRHFHPSTAIMARTLLAGTHIVYNGDPLKDLNAVAFLGKFVRKKPKATSSKFSKKALDGKEGDANTTEVGSSDFVELDEQVVNPEDLFFHKYYSQKVKAVARKGASDDDEIDPKKIDSQDSQDSDSEPDYDKLGDAMFAAGGENSEDSGEVSDSDDLDSVNGDEEEGMVEEDGDEQDSEEDSGEIASLLEMEDTEFEKEEQRSNEGPMEDDGPFASAELYEDQINTLISSSVNVEDFLANDKKRKGGAQDKKKEKKKIKKKKLTPVK